MIYESDLVALLIDLPDTDLVRGDVGTVAMIHGDQKGFEIEFVNADGKTISVETLSQSQIKKINQEKAILHVPEMELQAWNFLFMNRLLFWKMYPIRV